jgi:hypothetical protein
MGRRSRDDEPVEVVEDGAREHLSGRATVVLVGLKVCG